jgi:hypothetical protein
MCEGVTREGFQRKVSGSQMPRSEMNLSTLYTVQHVSSVIKFDENRCMDLISVFPSVVTFGVALSFD